MDTQQTDFEIVFKRLERVGIKRQWELAKILGKTQSAISYAKRGGKFPRGWAEILGRKFDIPLDFLLSGQYKGTAMASLIDKLKKAEKENAELREQLKEQENLLVGREDRPIQSVNSFIIP